MWAFRNISKTLPDQVWDTLFSNTRILQNIYLELCVLPFAYIILHKLFMKFTESYRTLKPDSQTIVIHHMIECIMLSCLFPP